MGDYINNAKQFDYGNRIEMEDFIMEIDLSEISLFDSNTLDLDKKVTFILGKNGTGKTTMTDVLSAQTDDYEISVFKGFDNIIDDNKRLNAVVLGEENATINKQIEDIREKIAQKITEKKRYSAEFGAT